MAAGLDALRDHRVDAGRGGCLRLTDRADLHEHLDPVAVRGLDERCRVPPEQHDQRHPRLHHGVELLADEGPVLRRKARVLERGDDQIHAKRPTGQLPHPRDPPPDLRNRHVAPAKHPAAARRRDRSGQLRPVDAAKPTEKIGYSMPSAPHSGVCTPVTATIVSPPALGRQPARSNCVTGVKTRTPSPCPVSPDGGSPHRAIPLAGSKNAENYSPHR